MTIRRLAGLIRPASKAISLREPLLRCIVGPILLVVFADTLAQGSRGQLIVHGHGFVVAALATALILRGVYALGFSRSG
jgi:hypothetical protein